MIIGAGMMAFVAGSLLQAETVQELEMAATENLVLQPHPRLWVPKDNILHLKDKLHSPYMRSAAARIIADADWLVDLTPIAQDEVRTNQQGTRLIASHLKCLTSAYVLKREQKYRDAAMRHLANILNWQHISCEANINTPPERKMFFCLSYGEHSADIALMYDIFRPDITPEEQKIFFDVLDRFYLWQALRAYERPPWWVNKSWSNWNGVCAGGMGMLALAFYDDRPEVRKLIPFVEKSLSHYFESYIENGGGNHEGTGYWNYGMHYAVRYLLSYENATGKKHPAFDVPELGKSLHFPVDFTGITFGDNDGWHPAGFFFLMAKRTEQPNAAMRAATFLMHEVGAAPDPETRPRLTHTYSADILYAGDAIPSEEAMLALQEQRRVNPQPLARVYDGLGWGVLMDDSAFPTLRLSARGGSSKITGHGHLDLLGFKCAINGERMIEDQRGWMPSVAFTGRGHHLYSRSAASKSSLFVDGLGCAENVTCPVTEVVNGEGLQGIRIDARGVYRRGGFVGRLFLLVDQKYWIVVDTAPGRAMESRFHTYATLKTGDDWALLEKGGEKMAITFASLDGSTMQHSFGMPENPVEQTKIIRWISKRRPASNLHVTAMHPGTDKLALKLSQEEAGYRVEISTPADTRVIRLARDLTLVPAE
jgi:hypothetical protein